jgi:hypothetical protein
MTKEISRFVRNSKMTGRMLKSTGLGSGQGARSLKHKVEQLLRAPDFAEQLSVWSQLPARQVVNPLFSFLCSTDDTLKLRAVSALGQVVAGLANADLESARVVVRRLIWSLNDESGGIGWGAPEAIGEILASHEVLAGEYAHILLSLIREDGNFLELPLLQRGVLWGLARLAAVRPQLLQQAAPYVAVFVDSVDQPSRELAAQVLSLLNRG